MMRVSPFRRTRRPARGKSRPDGLAHGLRKLTVRQAVVDIAIGVLLALPPVFVNHPVAYIPFVAYLFLLVADFAYLQLTRRGLSIDYDSRGDSCMRGTSVELPLVLRNGSRLPILRACPQVYVENPYGELEHETLAVVLVDSRGEETIRLNVRLGHVGVYAAGVRGVVLHGPLRLFHARVGAPEGGRAELVSTPQLLENGSFELSALAMRESMAPVRTVLSDDIDYAGTREYELGDPLKSVHWKLSARTGELQTRLFETSVNTRLSVIMDFHGPEYSSENLMTCADAIVEMALVVVRLGLAENMEAALCYIDREGSPVSSGLPHEKEMEAFVRELPRLSPQVSAQDAVGIVEREAFSPHGSDNIVVCTSCVTRELVQSVLGLVARHVRASVILAVPRELVHDFYSAHQGLMGELSSAGVPCLVLSDASELEGGAANGQDR